MCGETPKVGTFSKSKSSNFFGAGGFLYAHLEGLVLRFLLLSIFFPAALPLSWFRWSRNPLLSYSLTHTGSPSTVEYLGVADIVRGYIVQGATCTHFVE